MAQLRELVLHKPNHMHESDCYIQRAGEEGTFFSCLGPSLAQMTALTRLVVPFDASEPLGLLLQLPAGLQELGLGMGYKRRARANSAVDADGGAVQFGFSDGVQVGVTILSMHGCCAVKAALGWKQDPTCSV